MTLSTVLPGDRLAAWTPWTEVAGPARTRVPALLGALAPVALGLVGVVLAVLGLVRADIDRVDGLGLFSALPPAYWVGVAAVLVAAVIQLARSGSVVVPAVALVLLTHGAPALVEDRPRFPVAYLHAGYAQFVAQTGHTLPAFDARASWPGFFDLFAMVQQWGGEQYGFLLPVAGPAMELAYLLPLLVIARSLGIAARGQGLLLVVFPLLNWVGQDYFAPQALAYLLLLTVVALVLHYLAADAPPAGGRPWTRWQGLAATPRTWSRGTRSGVLGLCLAMCAAVIVSHQLTPLLLVTATAGLAFVGTTRLRMLPVTVLVATFGYFSYLGVPYWRNHLDQVFGGVGDVNANVTSGVGARVRGSAQHLLVVEVRLAVAVLVALAAVVACVVLARRRRLPAALLALAAAPAPLVLLQSYGGEGVLRAYLFGVPAAALLLAAWFSCAHLSRPRWVALGAALMLLVPLFVLTRFGNEDFERVRAGELEAVQYAQRTVPDLGIVFLYNEFSASGFQPARGQLVVRAPVSLGPDALDVLAALPPARRAAGTLVVLTTSQVRAGIQLGGLPADWGTRALAELRRSPDAVQVFADNGNYVFRLDEEFARS